MELKVRMMLLNPGYAKDGQINHKYLRTIDRMGFYNFQKEITVFCLQNQVLLHPHLLNQPVYGPLFC